MDRNNDNLQQDTPLSPGSLMNILTGLCTLQRMITAHHHVFRGWILHNHRAGLVMDVTGEGTMRVVGTRLKQSQVNAHAWCMVVAFGILLPLGIIWARYFRVRPCQWALHARVSVELYSGPAWAVGPGSCCTTAIESQPWQTRCSSACDPAWHQQN